MLSVIIVTAIAVPTMCAVLVSGQLALILCVIGAWLLTCNIIYVIEKRKE